MFTPGMKVQMVSDEPAPGYMRVPLVDGPVIGGVYTIRSMEACRKSGCLGLRFHEIKLPARATRMNGVVEPAFYSEWFRPLVERKTDISFAHEILRKVEKRNPARTHA